MLRVILFVILSLGWAAPVLAHQANFPTPQHVDDYVDILDPSVSRAYYAELNDFPHVYRLTLDEPSQVFFELLLPDIEGVDRQSSLLLVRRESRGVKEVARAGGAGASWKQFQDQFGNDSYLSGPSFSGELEAGTYIIEVSTPNNQTKYVFVSGMKEQFKLLNYFSILTDISRVKQFYGKSAIRTFESPVLYVPLGIIVLLVIWWNRKRQKQHA